MCVTGGTTTGSFPLSIETPGAIARQVVNVVFYDLSLDELRTYRQRANGVTPDDVQRVARNYLDPDRLSIVMVGNAAAFKDQLRKAGIGRRFRAAELHVGARI